MSEVGKIEYSPDYQRQGVWMKNGKTKAQGNFTEALVGLRAENETLRSLLREFVTPPLSYAAKKELVERTRLVIEGWE